MTLSTDLPDGPPVDHQDRDAYEVANDVTEDWAYDESLQELVALYEMDGLPFTVQRFPAGEVDA